MTRKPLYLIAAAAALALSGPTIADRCDHKAQREANIDLSGADLIEIIGRAGSLNIIGRDGLNEVRATGQACASDDALLAKTVITARREGGSVLIIAEIPEHKAGWMNDSAHLDLTVEIPSDVALKVTDSSGDLEIERVASLQLQDSSGETTINDVAGDIWLQDSSGSLKITNVGGHINLTDSSGDIRLERVDGDIVIESDSSGDIDINEARSVLIEQDSSGGIDVRNVHEDVTVRTDSSGGITVKDIGGDFVVGRDSGGGINYSNVAGKVDVPGDKKDWK
jgi:hypothetical protein